MDEQLWARALARLGVDELARLVRDRPDVARPFAPADLEDLAERLMHPRSLVAALNSSPVPHLQLLQAAQAIGSPCPLDELTGLLAGGERAAVERIVDDLDRLKIVLRTSDAVLLPAGLRALFPDALGLGPPISELLQSLTVAVLQGMQRKLGIRSGPKRAEVLQSVLDFFARLDDVAEIIDAAPPATRALIAQFEDDDSDDDDTYDYTAYAARRAAVQWGAERGLLFHDRYDYSITIPAEVTRAARGPHWRAPFEPDPPSVAIGPVDPEQVQRESAAAAGSFSALALAVLDRIAHTPVPTLKSGGIGARELGKLAKGVAADESGVRLVLELAGALGLLADDGGRLATAPSFAAARSGPPADLLAALLTCWWVMGSPPSVSVDGDGKARRVLAGREECEACRAARRGLAATLGELGALDAADLAAVTFWRHPLVHVSDPDAQAPFATTMREAEVLGVFAARSLSPLGRALLTDDAHLLAEAAAAVLPAATEHAVFGSDLTAFVAGTPSGRVSALLDASADRESRGGAVTWRFSPGSVRRAFDDGVTGDDLLEQLAVIADSELPQALRYLIGAVARRHGHLRLSDASSVIRSDDAALLEIVVRDRALAKHGLRLLAPTVLAADVPAETLLAALRKAGYLPVLEGGTRAVPAVPAAPVPPTPASIRRIRAAAAQPEPRPEPDVDPTTLARDLLRAPGVRNAPPSVTERRLSTLVDGLTRSEVRLLAHAVDSRGPVRIDYLSSTGARSTRVIRDVELFGSAVTAWCELRQDERIFTLSRIVGVAAP